MIQELRRRQVEAERANKPLEAFYITKDQAKELAPQFVALAREVVQGSVEAEEQIYQSIVNGECRLFAIPLVVD